MKVKPCPKCGSEIKLHIVYNIDIDYNCFARCQKCKEKYILPYINLKLSGVVIHKDSIKKIKKTWNTNQQRFFEI